MANLKYSDKHNMVAFLKKPNESVGFTEVVDFLKGTSLRYALTHNPTIYDSLVKQFWQTATVRTLANGTQQLVASIDSKEYTITKASVRSKLQLADATGIHNLSDAKIYAGLATLGYVTEGAAMDQGDGSVQPAEPHHIPVDPLSSTSLPPIPSLLIPSSPLQSTPYLPLQSPPHSPLQSPPHLPLQSPSYSPPHYSSPRSYEAPLPEGNISGSAEASIQLKELIVLVPNLVTRVTSLEKELKETKQTHGNTMLKLGKEPEDQGRIIQDIDDDPLVSLFRESMKGKSTDFVASQSVIKANSTDKGKRYRRRARSMAKNINTGLDAEDEINKCTSSTILSPKKGQREGKAQMVEEDIQATHKTKEQIRQEEAGLEEAIRLQAQMDEEVAKQIHLDKMVAKRVQEEQELAKLEANTEVVKSLQGESISNDDFAKWNVENDNEKKKFYDEQKAKA
ncbi:hypothetical protein Tco_0725512 [Tanacetum coccineum]|uniref:Xylulose kinase-1 n=1 Tax=Tanacetum coccineum TaxID=301880 RepID=A0ABQ4YF92_9ASTR